jgi:hypothetical protein
VAPSYSIQNCAPICACRIQFFQKTTNFPKVAFTEKANIILLMEPVMAFSFGMSGHSVQRVLTS